MLRPAAAIVIVLVSAACLCAAPPVSGADGYKVNYTERDGIKITFPGNDNTLVMGGISFFVSSDIYNPYRLGSYIYDHDPDLGRDYGQINKLPIERSVVNAGCVKFTINMNSAISSDIWIAFKADARALLTDEEKESLRDAPPVEPDVKPAGGDDPVPIRAATPLDITLVASMLSLVFAFLLLGTSVRTMSPILRAREG